MNKNRNVLLGILGVLLLVALVCSCIFLGLGGYTIITRRTVSESSPSPETTTRPTNTVISPTLTSQVIRPTISPTESTSPPTASATPESNLADPFSLTGTLRILENTIIPINDPIDLARRLEGKTDLPVTLEPPPAPLQVGDRQSFWVLDADTNERFQVQAVLRYLTDHAYFWMEEGLAYDESALSALLETFENEIYPTNQEFFGSEWNPGVDSDPHLYILYANGLGSTVAGYFSPGDEFTPQVHEFSNAHEMFLISATQNLRDEYTYSTLAHEHQHMIHWYRDRNEESWVNEGFSELAAFLNGYGVGAKDQIYALDPDLQLTDWPADNTIPHYGASFLFLTYFLDRFGEEATKALVSDPANGMVSIDFTLSRLGVSDPQTGQEVQADDIFRDWILASFLQDPTIADGRFTYNNYPDAPQPSPTEYISDCPQEITSYDVHQFGADYIQIDCPGDFTLRFEGSPEVGLVPVNPYSGSYAFYSNTGDESDMTLSQEFDFRDHTGPLTFEYWTWYDIEEDFDYLYLLASVDGETWQFLTTPSGTGDDPTGNSYGWAYNGFSGGGPDWIMESVDISEFAGQQVQLRFEYITDGTVTGEGFLIDDISIPEIGYFTDFEQDDGGWQAEGFVRIRNVLPQNFQLTLISVGETTAVEVIEIGADNAVEIPISNGGDVDYVVLVVSGTTRFTRQKAFYQLSISPP